jgi:hypothetical protein
MKLRDFLPDQIKLLTLPAFFVLLSVQAKIYFPSCDSVRNDGFKIPVTEVIFESFPLRVSNS